MRIGDLIVDGFDSYKKTLNRFWYKIFGGMTIRDVMPIIFTGIAICFVWCLLLTFLIILK
jgi:hypothetical protein